MWFLIRVGFWLSLVILLLPTGQSQSVAEGPQIGTVEAISAASAAVSDARQFCMRQPDACAVGSQALTAFGHKAQAGAKMVYEFLTEKLKPENTSAVADGQATVPLPEAKPAAGTLTPSDRAPAWRGTAGRPEVLARRD